MGLFVTFEGGEGVGKSTLIRSLADAIRGMGHSVVLTREPGGSPLGERLRSLLLSGAFRSCGPEVEAAIFAAARSDHLSKTIVPALRDGSVVLCDRFYDSTRAYQGAAGSVPDSLLDALVEEAVGTKRPDLTLVLDCPVEVGLARANSRRLPGATVDRFESEGLAFHSRIREEFLSIARSEPARCRVLDASSTAAGTLEQALDALLPLLSGLRRP